MAVAALADREKNDSLLSYYDEQGYVVVRNLVSGEGIANLLALYARDIVPTRQRFFRQSSSRYERNHISAHGYVRQSFLDIHDDRRFPEFSAAARDIFCGEEMMETIGALTGAPHHNLVRTMLFDLGAASGPYQDRHRPDRVPNGSPVAAWVALEDIREDAGRFYVMPGSHERRIKRIGVYVEEHRSSQFAPALRRGDVLFWNLRTVHGALPARNEKYSRKSLIAHYIPSHLGFGTHYKEYAGVRCYRNQPQYSLLNHVVYALKARLGGRDRSKAV